MRVKKILLGIISLTIFFNPYFIYADEITVSGNGEGSSNNVNVASSQNTQTQQTNNAEINNNVDLNANTGNNSANENNGEKTNITTGDVISSSQIVNAEINQSSVEVGCCQDSTNINISGNGSDSTNYVGYSQNNNTNITINQSANVNNSVNGSANTGENSANDNLGSVKITTGDIYATDKITNKRINIYEVKGSAGLGGEISLIIEGNAADSDNSIKFSNDNNLRIDVNNSANIVNDSHWDLNTGRNGASKNNGDVEITTGDIVFSSTIENTDINVGLVDIECCEQPKGGPNPPPDGTPPPPPPTQPGGPPGPSSNPTSGGAPAVLGAVLPVTGNYSMFLFLIGNIVMFFLGWYLRLRSGRSPNFVYAA